MNYRLRKASIAVLCMAFCVTATSSCSSAPVAKVEPYQQKPVDVLEYKVTKNQAGGLIVSGTVMNRSTKVVPMVRLDFDIFDKKGDMFGQLGGLVSNLKPKEVQQFQVALVRDAVKAKYKSYQLIDPNTKKPIGKPVKPG